MLFRKKTAAAGKGEELATKTPDAVAPQNDQPSSPDAETAPADHAKAAATGEAQSNGDTDIEYPHGITLVLLLSSVFISMFLVALDRLIIATAVPQITDDFHSVQDIGWYGSAFLLATCAFQLLFGKLYQLFSIKYLFLGNILVFEIGSAVCGAAPSSLAFIIGRAIAGVGSSGIFSGVIVIIVYTVPLHKRPMYQGLFGAVFGLASVLGPLVGGAFTTHVTWRWCFYINLPLGGAAMVFVFFLLHIPDRESTHRPLREKLAQLDGIGTFFFVPGSVCLLLAVEWGGSTYAWSSGRVVALLVIAGVFLVAFVAVQILRPDTATVPPRIFMQRSICSGFFATFCVGGQMMIFVYYLPIWFQAIKGVSAFSSGIRTLPLVLAMVSSSILSGIAIMRIGYYTPVMLLGVVYMCVASGLLTTLQVDTPQPKWVGYQFLFGWGMGHTFQAPNLAAQTVLSRNDVSIGASLMFFGQMLGGSIFLAVAQNVLDSQLLQRLSNIPGFDAKTILSSGATSLTNLPDDVRQPVLVGYNESLRHVFWVGLVLTCLIICGAGAMEWRSVKKKASGPDGPGGPAGAAEEGAAGSAKAKTDEDSQDKGVAHEGDTKKAIPADGEKEHTGPDESNATMSQLDVEEDGHSKRGSAASELTAVVAEDREQKA